MKYSLESFPISKLIELRKNDELILNPPYQRNPIWSRKAQKGLITSILNNWPLPTIFLRKKDDGKYEVVDGQQRLRAIIEFHSGRLSDLDGNFLNQNSFTSSDVKTQFYDYQVPVTIIEKIENDDRIEDFYALVNRTGLRLNKLELAKAEYYNTEFLSLLQELTDEGSPFSKLGLFTKAAKDRMNDLDFASELLALLKFGISDKKDKVADLFDRDINAEEAETLRNSFLRVISSMTKLSNATPLKSSRLRQKNDFYTFFGLISRLGDEVEHQEIEDAYLGLLALSPLIRPSQEDCDTLQTYATHCVTQSNSKAAREERERILMALFYNDDANPSSEQKDVLEYFKLDASALKKTSQEWISLDHSKLRDPRQPDLFDSIPNHNG